MTTKHHRALLFVVSFDFSSQSQVFKSNLTWRQVFDGFREIASGLKMPKDPVSEYTYSVARQRVASICLALGWNSANASAMEVSSAFTSWKNKLIWNFMELSPHEAFLVEISRDFLTEQVAQACSCSAFGLYRALSRYSFALYGCHICLDSKYCFPLWPDVYPSQFTLRAWANSERVCWNFGPCSAPNNCYKAQSLELTVRPMLRYCTPCLVLLET